MQFINLLYGNMLRFYPFCSLKTNIFLFLGFKIAVL